MPYAFMLLLFVMGRLVLNSHEKFWSSCWNWYRHRRLMSRSALRAL